MAQGNSAWPPLNDMESAKKAARQGVWAAGIVAVVTALLAVLAGRGVKVLNIDSWAFVDAALFAIIAFGIHKMSRVAAVAWVCLYVLERLYMWQTNGVKAGGIIMPVILTLAFINSIRGTFTHHRLSSGNPPGTAPAPPLG